MEPETQRRVNAAIEFEWYLQGGPIRFVAGWEDGEDLLVTVVIYDTEPVKIPGVGQHSERRIAAYVDGRPVASGVVGQCFTVRRREEASDGC